MANKISLYSAFAAIFIALSLWAAPGLARPEKPDSRQIDYWLGKEAAQEMIARSERKVNAVYPYVAQLIVAEFGLGDFKGKGLDIGAGPGRSTLEIAKLTPGMTWINVDINKHFFPYFMERAQELGLDSRVNGVQGSADSLPFDDSTFDYVISRGSYKFWGELDKALREVLRVMKPGAFAYIGRGYPANLPAELAAKLRKGQTGPRRHPLDKDVPLLRNTLKNLPLDYYWISKPQPAGTEGLSYGIWFMFRKPL